MLGGIAMAQCPTGEVEVTIDVQTDNFAYETYWELVPNGNNCGNGSIFSGGNSAVGCNGAAQQNQTPGGYPNNQLISEGPWCLTEGDDFDIIWVDDWGDGGLSFTVNIDGFAAFQFDGTGAGNTFTFNATPPPPNEAEADQVVTPGYVGTGNVDVSLQVRNLGSSNITSIDYEWQIDNGTATSGTVTGLNIAPFETGVAVHPNNWNASTNGTFELKCTITGVNGSADPNPANNVRQRDVIVGPGTPNIVDDYLILSPVTLSVIGNATDNLSQPRDLDFHPDLTRKELWVINKDTENSGGSTTTFFNAGEANQTEQWKRDGNAWHFMSLPTGIAFSPDNFNFATSNGVYDANHQASPGGPGSPFTGPTLWSSDMSIYAEPSGGNGSHLDMLHESPQTQGIAWESGNAFWVFDGRNQDIVKYDFRADHGPGNDDHSDGEIFRYSDVTVSKDPNDHIVSHLVLDDQKKWLYIVDHGNDKVFRLDITTGTQGGTPTYGPFEPLAIYTNVTGATTEDVVTTGLVEPAGIDIIEDRMIVSDHSNGDIIIYDISSIPATELGRIQTGTPGVMGVKIGPAGHIWYTNASTNEVVRLDANGLGIDERENHGNLTAYPNPATTWFTLTSADAEVNGATVEVMDATGKLVMEIQNFQRQAIQTENLEAGVYMVRVTTSEGKMLNQRLILR